MRAVHCTAYGEPKDLVLADLPEPSAGPGEVVVAVEAVGLGFVDGLHVRGGYQVKQPLPFIPGSELAGRIVAVGEGVPAERVGTRIVALSNRGGLAERVALDAAICVPIPDGFSSPAAASALINYCTGIYGLDDCGHLKAGETVLVLGASGGVGMAAIDIAKGFGATVVAAASSPKKLAAAVARGADLTVDYSLPDWRKALEAALGGRRLDVVYDPVGGPFSEIAFRCLAPGGRHLVVGFAAGEIPRLPLNLALLKRASLVGVDWGGHVRADAKAGRELVERLIGLVAAGRISPRPETIYPLDEAPAALQALLDRRSIGKPVIAPGAHRPPTEV